MAAMEQLRKEARRRLADLCDSVKKVRRAILKDLTNEIPATTEKVAIVREVREDQTHEVKDHVGLPIGALPCLPEIVSESDALRVKNRWLVTGIHACVVFGLVELFVDGLLDSLVRCDNCGNFYLKTPKLKVACSAECKRKLRLKDVAANVKRHRQRRQRQRA